MRAVPSLGSRIPQSIRITVDFPEPFGPRNPKIDPLPTLNETSSTAVKVPKRLVKPSHSIIASDILRKRIRKTGTQERNILSEEIGRASCRKKVEREGGSV